MRKTAVIIGMVAIIAVIAILLLRSGGNPAMIGDADLQFARLSIPAESNGFQLLLAAGQRLAISEDEESDLSELQTASSWDDALARGFLDANREALELFRQAGARPQLQVSAPTNSSEEFPYLKEWRLLMLLALIEARLAFHGGDERLGFEKALAVTRFGQQVQAGGGGLLHYLAGSASKSRGLGILRQFADETTLPATSLLSFARELREVEASDALLRAALKVEYATQAIRFDEFATNTFVSVGGGSMRTPGFFLNPTRSKAELARHIRHTMIAATNCYADGVAWIPAGASTPTLLRLLRGNLIGSTLTEMQLPFYEHLLGRKCAENVALRATRLTLALRAFQMTHGRHAQTLGELVPDFLEAVPLDDFDCRPMRYSPELKVVYSVGKNLTDEGGVQSTNRLAGGDLVFPFTF